MNERKAGPTASVGPAAVASAVPPHLVTYAYLGFAIVAWGSNWPLLKLAVADAPPITFTAIRLLSSAAVIAILLAVWRQPLLPRRGERLLLGLSGFLQIGAILGLNMLGLQFLPPGRAAILTFTMPLWTIPFGIWLLREHPGRLKLAGGGIGLLGLVLFFNPALVDWHDRDQLLGNGINLLSGACWALGAVIYRRRRWQTAFWTQTFWQILMSGLPLVPAVALFEVGRPIHWTGILVFAWAFTAFLGTGIGYWCWARVLTALPATTAGQFTMLVPVIAFCYSAGFFGEQVTLQVLASVALIFAGVILTLRAQRR
ncbi:MAG TPA: DMT family transporter [Alphaproteobacteria bacterium]|nr:DMT family transporter [Alphaproteobacteria bacterium]